MIPAASSGRAASVQIWHAPVTLLDAPGGRRERALAWLTADERARHARLRRPEDRDMFLLGRLMARQLVAARLGVEPDRWRWRFGPNGRPEIDEADAVWSFNIAHSGGTVVCAIGAGRGIGVDLEHLGRPLASPDLIARVCAPEEAADVLRLPAGLQQHRFLRYWTLKEAYVKARGLGVGVRLTDARFLLDEHGGGARLICGPALKDAGSAWALHVDDVGDCLLAAAAPILDDASRAFTLCDFAAH